MLSSMLSVYIDLSLLIDALEVKLDERIISKL